jgi:hypothetical protein
MVQPSLQHLCPEPLRERLDGMHVLVNALRTCIANEGFSCTVNIAESTSSFIDLVRVRYDCRPCVVSTLIDGKLETFAVSPRNPNMPNPRPGHVFP